MDGDLRVGVASVAVPWWVVLVQGIALTVVGALLVFNTGVTTVVLVVFVGWWWLISGIFELASLLFDRTLWGWRLFSGLLGALAGLYIVGSPLLGTAIVVGVATLMLGINGMLIGVVDIARAAQGAGWGKGILGALSLVFGAIIAFNFTEFASALPWIWGVFASVAGIAAIFSAFQYKKLQSA